MLHSPAPTAVALLLAVPLWLAACDEGSAPQNFVGMAEVADGTPDATMRDGAAPYAGGGASEGIANDTGLTRSGPANAAHATAVDAPFMPSAGPGEAMKGEMGARAVLLDWAHALEQRDWARARAQWGNGGADSGLDPAAFAGAYAKYGRMTVSIGKGEGDAGAGSLYYTAPVTVVGTMTDGRPFRMEGPVTLRRVNDVDGASAAQLSWHISQSDLKPRP